VTKLGQVDIAFHEKALTLFSEETIEVDSIADLLANVLEVDSDELFLFFH